MVAKKKRKPSIRDVAAAAGVSRTAVSLVLNNGEIRISDEKRQVILDTAKKLGYRPHTYARRLARRKTDTIGLLYPYDPSALSEFFVFQLTRDIATAAKERRFDILLDFIHSAEPESYAPDPGRTDGTIILADRNRPEYVRMVEEGGHPAMIIGGAFMKRTPSNFVDADVKIGCQSVTKHLIELGHERIAFLAGIPSKDKFSGFEAALREAGLKINKALVLECGMAEAEIDTAIDQLLGAEAPPTAIVATNDTLGIRTIKVLQRKGVEVPKDMSLVGFDDIEPASLIMPNLTTVRFPIKELAEAAVSGLVARIEDKDAKPVRKVLPTELVVRDSSAPPAA